MEVKYLGRTVESEGFKAFVYGENDLKVLARSWDEFCKYIDTGLWFDSKEKLQKPEKRPRKKVTKNANSSRVRTSSIQTG